MMVRRCRPPHVSPTFRKPLLMRTNLALPAMDNVPFMLPINIRCNSCFQYIYQGTHLFVYKQEVLVEKNPGFEICRICLKCTNCSAKIRIWSDPENGEYDAAVSKKRNYQVAVSKQRKREAEEGGDALKSFENTTLGSKREISALDEMKSMELYKFDAIIRSTSIAMQQMGKKIDSVTVYDYRSIMVPLLKSLMRARLKDLAYKDAEEKSKAATEALLSALDLSDKKGTHKGGGGARQGQGKSKG